MTDDQQRARELIADWHRNKGCSQRIIDDCLSGAITVPGFYMDLITAALRVAPEGRLVVVGWLDAEDSHYPENYEFDYMEDGLWAKHEDCVEHAHAVAPPGSQMPKEQPPYQWWMDLPAFPAARPQGVKDVS